jgi:hypothetical protein
MTNFNNRPSPISQKVIKTKSRGGAQTSVRRSLNRLNDDPLTEYPSIQENDQNSSCQDFNTYIKKEIDYKGNDKRKGSAN